MNEGLEKVLLVAPALLLSLCIHEFAHAWMAVKKGDLTPRLLGRLTLNPLAHADFVGTFLLPVVCLYSGWPFIGWAKPVPVNATQMKKGRLDLALVAAAGPLSNLIQAVIGTVLLMIALRLPLPSEGKYYVLRFLVIAIHINVLLAFFNLLPFPPLDGFMVLQALLSNETLKRLRFLIRYGMLIIFALFFTGIFQFLISGPSQFLSEILVSTALYAAGL